MKLMIVDDEKLTREGLVNSIDWTRLGIAAVAQAGDGVRGLEIAQSFRPDIVLSDVRMPRMSGIDMARKLLELDPDISIIFMSGYSDKEYLKAAIHLKAVSYVEKPINPEEIESAVLLARQNAAAAKKAADIEALSLSLSRSALAVQLAAPPRQEAVRPNTPGLTFPEDPQTPFFTFLIRFYQNNYAQDVLEELIGPCIRDALSAYGLREIHAVRHGDLFFYHVWGAFDEADKAALGQRLAAALALPQLHYHVVIGKTVTGMDEICRSYQSAVQELQNTFFSRENTCRVYTEDSGSTPPPARLERTAEQLGDALLHKSEQEACGVLDTLLQTILARRESRPNQVKDLYYKLLTAVRDAYRARQVQDPDLQEPDDSIWGHISACNSVYALHDLLKERVTAFFASQDTEGNPTVYLIKQFIADHYQDGTLSIKDISSHVQMSSSYVCTLFKNETGSTLNQYLTEYRIAKAKRLLADPRNKIAGISAKVGYLDSNYFGKIFKKISGMSPSEYRERE